MRVRFVYERRLYAIMVKMRHGLTNLNSNNSVVYGQKHKVWVLFFLERAEHFETKWSKFGEIFCGATNHIVYSKERCKVFHQKTVISCLFVV